MAEAGSSAPDKNFGNALFKDPEDITLDMGYTEAPSGPLEVDSSKVKNGTILVATSQDELKKVRTFSKISVTKMLHPVYRMFRNLHYGVMNRYGG